MTPSPLTAIYGNWTRPSYERRVRGTAKDPTFLWGSAGLTQNFGPDKDLVLHIRNDTFGNPVTLGTQVTSGTQTQTPTSYGSLLPAECISIPLQGLSGVFAYPTVSISKVPGRPANPVSESVVACLITS